MPTVLHWHIRHWLIHVQWHSDSDTVTVTQSTSANKTAWLCLQFWIVTRTSLTDSLTLTQPRSWPTARLWIRLHDYVYSSALWYVCHWYTDWLTYSDTELTQSTSANKTAWLFMPTVISCLQFYYAYNSIMPTVLLYLQFYYVYSSIMPTVIPCLQFYYAYSVIMPTVLLCLQL